jgi:hypothetical protein
MEFLACSLLELVNRTSTNHPHNTLDIVPVLP